MSRVPCILFEDEHLLVVNKPAGWNTHAPAPFAGEGLYDWLRNRKPRWASLAIIHRLDKETSGLLVFGKTPLANRSLTAQFTQRAVRKEYRLATRTRVRFDHLVVRSALERRGDRYCALPPKRGVTIAETRFEVLSADASIVQLRAIPLTGRTHQIRVHAAARGFPVLGDVLYGGEPAPRLWLHAERLSFRHPATHNVLEFQVDADFALAPARQLREALFDGEETTAWRFIHGGSELGDCSVPAAMRTNGDRARLRQKIPSPKATLAGDATLAGSSTRLNQVQPNGVDFYVDRLGDYLLAQSAGPLRSEQYQYLETELGRSQLRGVYHRTLSRQLRGASLAETSPKRLLGEPAPERFFIRENGVRFELSFTAGASVGLFLDQRDNRRRLLTNYIAPGFLPFPGGATGAQVLNVFAYTCGFSVCAALAGAQTTNVDLSRKYLDWGRRHFEMNGCDPGDHQFLEGDALDWLRRLGRQRRRYAAIVLDPPTFSTSKTGRRFQAETGFDALVRLALPLLVPGGVLLASTNAARWLPQRFVETVTGVVTKAGRRIDQQQYVPQPPDFPISRREPAYLKTLWLRIVE